MEEIDDLVEVEERLEKLILVVPYELAGLIRSVRDDCRWLVKEVRSLRTTLTYRIHNGDQL